MDISKIIYSGIKFIPFYFIFLLKVLNIGDVKNLIFFKTKYVDDADENDADANEKYYESINDSDNETAKESMSVCSDGTIKQKNDSDESGCESDDECESGSESGSESNSEKNFKIKSILNDLENLENRDGRESRLSNYSSTYSDDQDVCDDDIFLSNVIKYELSDDDMDESDELSEMI